MTTRVPGLMLGLCLLGCATEGGDEGAGTMATEETGGGNGCTPGAINPCACPDGTQSQQTCEASGDAFGACECGTSTSATTTSASTTSGTTTSTTTSSSTTTPDDTGESTAGDSEDSGTTASDESSSTGPAPECNGTHPIVEGDLRYCEKGDCYCNDLVSPVPSENCFPADIADACCAVELVCY